LLFITLCLCHILSFTFNKLCSRRRKRFCTHKKKQRKKEREHMLGKRLRHVSFSYGPLVEDSNCFTHYLSALFHFLWIFFYVIPDSDKWLMGLRSKRHIEPWDIIIKIICVLTILLGNNLIDQIIYWFFYLRKELNFSLLMVSFLSITIFRTRNLNLRFCLRWSSQLPFISTT